MSFDPRIRISNNSMTAANMEAGLTDKFDKNFDAMLKKAAILRAGSITQAGLHGSVEKVLTNIKRKSLQFDMLDMYSLARDLMQKYLQAGYREELRLTFSEHDFARLVKTLIVCEETDIGMALQAGSAQQDCAQWKGCMN